MSGRVTIIAEIGSVHDGSFGNAKMLIEAAAAAGADVVKFQTHIAEAETLADAPAPSYFKAEPRMEYFRRTSFTLEQWLELKAKAGETGVGFLSSPFSEAAVDLLEQVGVDAYKIPSGEVSNLPMLERVAATGKPTYLSSGMSNWAELDAAVNVLKAGGPLVVMQCSSAYPCAPEQVGLNVIGEMAGRWDLPVGFSDHTLGPAAALAAVAVGAVAVEKHFTFSQLMYGSDAAHSMEPPEFKAMTGWIREVAAMRDHRVDKDDISPYVHMKQIFEKSVVSARSLSRGVPLAQGDFNFKKPGDGIPAARWAELVGRVPLRDIPKDTKLTFGDFEE